MMENRRPGEALMGSFRGTLVGTDPPWKGLQRDALTPEAGGFLGNWEGIL